MESFLQYKALSMSINSFKGHQFTNTTGILCGSSPSPILSLFFVSAHLPELQPPSSTLVGSVDCTNILTWSDPKKENYRNLEKFYVIVKLEPSDMELNLHPKSSS